nr:DUF4124 domain-containing protein [Alteromonas sp. 5E99-2]
MTLCLLDLSASVTAQTVYKIVQDDGTVIYSDQAGPNAEAVDLSSVKGSTVPSLATPKAKKTKTISPTDQTNYQLRILTPAPEITLRNNNGQVTISAELEPALDSVEYHLHLDNNKVISQRLSTFLVDDIYRGEHSFFISASDNTGKTLASSQPQTFYMQKVSVITNPSRAN